MFSVGERIEMSGKVLAGYANVRVDTFDGLLVTLPGTRHLAIVKGLRAVSDFRVRDDHGRR